MENLSDRLDELRTCGETIISIAEAFKELLPAKEPPKETPPLTLEDIRHELALIAQAGFSKEIKELITQHGADRLSDVEPAQYAALLAEAKAVQEVKADG